MTSVHDILRPLFLFINAFFRNVLSFLRHTWGCSTPSNIDIEQPANVANVPSTPGQDSPDLTFKGSPGAKIPLCTPPAVTTVARCTLAEALKRYATLRVLRTQHRSLAPSHPDASTSTDEKASTGEPSIVSPDVTGATKGDPDKEMPPVVPPHKSMTEVDEKPVLSVEVPVVEVPTEEVIPTSNRTSIGAEKGDDHHYVLDVKDVGETKGEGCEADMGGKWHGSGIYDYDDIYQDDFEFPEHRELRLAIEHLLLHRLPNTIKEVAEEEREGGKTEEDVSEEDSVAISQIKEVPISRTVPPPLPIIVVQGPTAEEALRRAQEATDDLAALAESIEADSSELSGLSTRRNTYDSGDPAALGSDWLNGALEQYYKEQAGVSSQTNTDLIPDDPFADVHFTSSRTYLSC